MSAPTFVPVLMFKGGRYQVAYSQVTVTELQWNGWALVGLYGGPPQRSLAQRVTALEDIPPGTAAAHAVTHAVGGTDLLTPVAIGAATEVALTTEKNRAIAVEAGKVNTSDPSVTNFRVPVDLSVTNAKVAGAAAISADKLADGVAKKVLTESERTKLSGVDFGATANSADGQLRDRTTHVGQQPSTSISDFTEAVQDAVSVLLGAGSNVTLFYDDAANTLTVSAATTGGAGLDAEAVRDAIGVALIGVGNIAVVVNDAADTITISTTATVNSTDAALRARTSHSGEQPVSTVTGLQTALDAKLLATDASVTNARIPTAHATSHATGGTDPVTAAAIGAVPNQGASTIAGVKTFSASPVVPTPVGTTDAANKAYVDASGGTGGTAVDATTTTKGVVQLAGDFAGTAAAPTVPGKAALLHAAAHASGAADPITPASIGAVAKDGGQTINGTKTFTLSPIVPTPTTATQAAPKGYADGLMADLDAEPIFFPAKVLDTVQGTWTNPTVATATVARGLVGTIAGKLSVLIRLPTTWTSAEFAVYWTVSDATAGNVHMQAISNQYDPADVLSGGAAGANLGPFAAPGVVGKIVRTSLGNIGLNSKPMKQFVFFADRVDASDTYAGDLQIIGLEITKVA